MKATARTHVLLPRELLDEIDQRVGQRRRSQFLVEAAREKLERDDATRRYRERVAAARLVAGSLAGRAILEWERPESIDAWIRSSRTARDVWLDAKRETP